VSATPFDDLEYLRHLRDEALATHFDDPLVDAYHRGSIQMAWNEIANAELAQPLPPLLDSFRVEVLGVERVGSALAGQIAAAVQKATNQMDVALRRPRSTMLRQSAEDVADTVVIQEGAAGNSLIFRAPAAALSSDELELGTHAGRASRALRELMKVLPENKQDIGSFVRGIGSAPIMERQAVQTISRLTLRSPHGLGLALNLEQPSESVRSIFDKESAEHVNDYLHDRKTHPSTEVFEGAILDGFRGTRRVFYLITEDGREIAGSVDNSLLPAVRRLAGSRVKAYLTATQWAARSGQLGPKHYDLERLEPDPDDPSLFAKA
jgi:hypothetical protein